jgi:hypothetical protein
MISDRNRNLLLFSIPLIAVHGIEEGSTGILGIDPLFRYSGIYAPYVLAVEIALIALVFYLGATGWGGKKIHSVLLLTAGLLYLVEIQHILAAISRHGYYPGLVSAVVVVGIGLLFWNELLQEKRIKREELYGRS